MNKDDKNLLINFSPFLAASLIMLTIMILVSCSTTTYEEPPVEPTDWEKCEPFLTEDAEAWSTCMAIV